MAVVLGNRGKCAQPCRLPYSLISKSNTTSSEKSLDKGYLLSPSDLCALEYLPNLIHAGVHCFKIEGRLKSPEYVATVTRIYRKYIDMVLNGEPYIIDENDKKDLMQVFNRGGFSAGHLSSEPNQNLIFKEKPNNMGIFIGTVENYNQNKGHIKLQLKDSLSIGDTISFEKEDSRYTVSELMIGNQNLATAKPGDKVTVGRMKGNISGGNKIYKLASKALSTTAKQSYEAKENKKILVNGVVTIKKDMPITMQIICTNSRHSTDNYHNIKLEVKSDISPEPAVQSPLTSDRVIGQISKTNNTPFAFENLTIDLEDGLYIPKMSSTLNELRRTALDMLEAKVIAKKTRKSDTLAKITPPTKKKENTYEPKVSVLLRNLSTDMDYGALDQKNIDSLYLPLKLFATKKHVEIIQSLTQTYDVYIYMPTIIKANYRNLILNSLEDILKTYSIKGFVISNLADFKLLEKYHKDYTFIGNYSLNVFNTNSLKELKALGLSRVTVSRELSKDTLQSLLSNAPIETELIVYGNLPIMAMNYCLLGKTNKCYPNCGINCLKNNTYYLKDRLGYEFRIIPDEMQTVSLICNSKTLSISSKDLDVNYVRVDILDENIEEINHIVQTAKAREKLEGQQYTNGNFHREV